MTRVAITAWGAVSPFGLTPEALWNGLVSGASAVRPVARHVAGGLPVTAGGQVPIEASDAEPALVMSQRPIDDALRAAGLRADETALLWANGLDTFAHDESGALVERSAGACFNTVARAHARPRRMI